jgi:hypothetical protein
MGGNRPCDYFLKWRTVAGETVAPAVRFSMRMEAGGTLIGPGAGSRGRPRAVFARIPIVRAPRTSPGGSFASAAAWGCSSNVGFVGPSSAGGLLGTFRALVICWRPYRERDRMRCGRDRRSREIHTCGFPSDNGLPPG